MMQANDYGNQPYVVDIEELTLDNNNFRTASWTGKHLQMTVMSVEVGGEIGLEIHENTDQFLRIEQGKAKVVMGPTKDNLSQEWDASDDFAIFIPTDTWHNIINVGDVPLKLYSIYAPSHHAFGTVHETYEIAMAAEAEEEHQ